MLKVNQKLDIKGQIYIVKKSKSRERFVIKLFNPAKEFIPVLTLGALFEMGEDMFVVTKTLVGEEFLIRHMKYSEVKDLKVRWEKEEKRKKDWEETQKRREETLKLRELEEKLSEAEEEQIDLVNTKDRIETSEEKITE